MIKRKPQLNLRKTLTVSSPFLLWSWLCRCVNLEDGGDLWSILRENYCFILKFWLLPHLPTRYDIEPYFIIFCEMQDYFFVIVPRYTRKCQCQTSITVRKLQENNVNNAEAVYLFLHPSLNFKDYNCDVVIPYWHHWSVTLFCTLETRTKTAHQK